MSFLPFSCPFALKFNKLVLWKTRSSHPLKECMPYQFKLSINIVIIIYGKLIPFGTCHFEQSVIDIRLAWTESTQKMTLSLINGTRNIITTHRLRFFFWKARLIRISKKAALSMDSDVDDDDDLVFLLLIEAFFSVGVCGWVEGPATLGLVKFGTTAAIGIGKLIVEPARPVAAGLTTKLWPVW